MVTSSFEGGSGSTRADRPAFTNPFPTLLALVVLHGGSQWSQLAQWHDEMQSALQIVFGVASLQVTATAFFWVTGWIHFETKGGVGIRFGKRAKIEFGQTGLSDGSVETKPLGNNHGAD
jgi:hypothetical protein